MARSHTQRRSRRASDRISTASNLLHSARKSEVAFSVLIAAHCEACQAMADAAAARQDEQYQKAAELSIQIARALERAPRPNPGLKRFDDLAAARRDADRRSLRTQNPHFVYRVSSKPRYCVLPGDHPVQGSIESGAIAMGSARLVHAGNPKGAIIRNPVDPKATPPRFLQGYPADTEWEYKGRQIRVRERRRGGRSAGEYKASWKEPTDEMDEDQAFGTTQQDALANARHKIDVYDLDLWAVDTFIHHAIDMLDESGDEISRASVARFIELAGRGRLAVPWGPENTAEAFKKFNALPLQDRLRLIDEVIDYQLRADIIDPKHVKRTKNPRPGKSPKRRDRSSFRRLMRL